jgi:hypothetical protein
MKKVIIALVLALGVFAVGSSVTAVTGHADASTTVTTNSSTPPDPFL